MAYTVLLFVHSWLRWAILALIITSLVRAATGKAFKDGLRVATVSAFDTQVLLGLVLYALSPMTPKSGAAFGAYMKVSALRFFTIEHGFAMILAAAAIHVGAAKAKRAADDRARNKTWAIALGVTLFFVLAGIPWPFMAAGRPLFRF